ncbi:hypothetical protein AB0B50_22405 [Streptomyces sp. NPDC041068]|uniref:hypothetical protein n=1 Tax=Streptomyces sp. NPDC041068 TaxID=3155130 RepID=UPI003405CB15
MFSSRTAGGADLMDGPFADHELRTDNATALPLDTDPYPTGIQVGDDEHPLDATPAGP